MSEELTTQNDDWAPFALEKSPSQPDHLQPERIVRISEDGSHSTIDTDRLGRPIRITDETGSIKATFRWRYEGLKAYLLWAQVNDLLIERNENEKYNVTRIDKNSGMRLSQPVEVPHVHVVSYQPGRSTTNVGEVTLINSLTFLQKTGTSAQRAQSLPEVQSAECEPSQNANEPYGEWESQPEPYGESQPEPDDETQPALESESEESQINHLLSVFSMTMEKEEVPNRPRSSYVCRLGDSLRSIAMRHPELNDVSLWKLVAEINQLSTVTDDKGVPVVQLHRGDVILLPHREEVAEFMKRSVLSVANNVLTATGFIYSPNSSGDEKDSCNI